MTRFWTISDRVALHIRPIRWTRRCGLERHHLSNGESHCVLWLGWTAITVLVRPASVLSREAKAAHRCEINRLAASVKALKAGGAPIETVQDTEMRLMEALGREHKAEMNARSFA